MRGLPSKEKPGLNDLAISYIYYTLHTLRRAIPIALAIEDSRPLWRDYSYWNGLVNGGVASANGVQGAFGRAGISWGYPDPTFPNFWQQFGIYNLYRSSYHVIYTDQSITNQADNWYRVHPERKIIPRMIDLQVNRGDSINQKATAVWDMSNLVLSRDDARPIIYGRVSQLDLWLSSWTTEMLNAHKYMIAQYSSNPLVEPVGPPTPPKRVDPRNVLWHQTADTFPGYPGETQNKTVDRDRWQQGSITAMHALIKTLWGGEVIPPPTPDPIAMYVTGTGSRIRSAPSESATIIGTMAVGSTWPIPALVKDSQDRLWSKVEDGVYFATWIGKLIYPT